MAFHPEFWATTATVASGVLVATAVALGQSIDTMVERVRERRSWNSRADIRQRSRARRRSLALSYSYGITSIVATVTALSCAMVCLMSDADDVPPWVGLAALFVGVLLIFVQVFASAEAKLSERQGVPDDESSLS